MIKVAESCQLIPQRLLRMRMTKQSLAYGTPKRSLIFTMALHNVLVTATFDEKKPELVNMQGMIATFYFKDGQVLKVSGKRGTYNNKTNDNLIINFKK